MPEINLPTKATQDLIKQDTTGILGNFPISGGTDWGNGTYSLTSQDGATTVREVTSGSGYFTLYASIYSTSTESISGSVTITVDGVILYDGIIIESSNYNPNSSFGGISFIRYNQSYKVEHSGINIRTTIVEVAD